MILTQKQYELNDYYEKIKKNFRKNYKEYLAKTKEEEDKDKKMETESENLIDLLSFLKKDKNE